MKTMMLGAALVLAAGVLAAQPSEPSGGMKDTGAADQSGAMMRPMSDANISSAIKTHNDVEIKESKLAVTRAVSADVKAFAKKMMREHDGNNNDLAAVEKKTGIRAKADEAVATRENRHINDYQQLSSHRNEAFDKLYLQHVISQHEAALKKIDAAVDAKSVRDSDLSGLVSKTREVEQRHLEEAQQLQSQLGGGAGSSQGGQTE